MAFESYKGGWSLTSSTDRDLGRLYLGLLAPLVVLYALTAQRTFAWQDSGAFQWRILQGELSAPGGLAVSHPLTILLGQFLAWLAPGPLAWRMNLVSALPAAVAAANIATLVRRLCPTRPAAWLAGAMFALAHTVWFNASICESQTLLTALMTTELHVLLWLCQRPRPQIAALLGLVNGLGLAAHNQALLSLSVYGLVVLSLCAAGKLKWRGLAALAAGWVLGSAPYLVMILYKARLWGWGPALESALFGGAPGYVGWNRSVFAAAGSTVRNGLMFMAYNFPNLALPLALVGVLRTLQALPGRVALALLGLTIVHLSFALTYSVSDQFMFLTPSYALIAILAGLGLGGPPGSLRRRRWVVPAATALLAAGPVLYGLAPSLVRAWEIALPVHHEAPGRDPLRYWLTPWKNDEESAQQFARAALKYAPSGSVIVADTSSLPPLLLVQATANVGPRVQVLHMSQATPETVPPGSRAFVVSDKPGRRPDWLAERATLPPRQEGQPLIPVLWKPEIVATQPAE